MRHAPIDDHVAAHHDAEARLYSLRLLRDFGDPGFDPAQEDAVLDEMEALWYAMSPEEQRILEAERAVSNARGLMSVSLPLDAMYVDVEIDEHARRGLPLLRAAG